ncbi:hypothetical protein AMECASPLE_015147 [Ameca splendens]|uniref:Uncharacterized protein n=1 Tax=Ameca splendens TaxID=208324 RepID=A0ABV0ZB48_9TELE
MFWRLWWDFFQKCDGALPVEFRSFAVDPQITSLEVLQHILIRAFDLNGKRNFSVSYLSRDRSSMEMYLSLLSDWDLDVAFMSAAKPFLQLKMDVKPSEDSKKTVSSLKQTKKIRKMSYTVNCEQP